MPAISTRPSRSRLSPLARAAAAALVMIGTMMVQETAASERAAPQPAASPRTEELLLQADVNDQRLDETVLALRTADGRISVQGESLDRWRLRRPDVGPQVVNGV